MKNNAKEVPNDPAMKTKDPKTGEEVRVRFFQMETQKPWAQVEILEQKHRRREVAWRPNPPAATPNNLFVKFLSQPIL